MRVLTKDDLDVAEISEWPLARSWSPKWSLMYASIDLRFVSWRRNAGKDRFVTRDSSRCCTEYSATQNTWLENTR